MREAINQAIDEEMARDPNVFILGAWGVLSPTHTRHGGPRFAFT